MKKLYTLSIALISAFSFGQNVVITTIVDGTLPANGCQPGTPSGSSSPKIVEMYVTGTVDFTGMKFQTESNGIIPPNTTVTWNAGLELTPIGTVSNSFVYLVYYITADGAPITFNEMYPSIVLPTGLAVGNLPNGNGNDAYRILAADGTTVIDQFGNPNDLTLPAPDDYNAVWAYQDSYAKRNNGVGPNGGNFVSSSFTYGGNNLFDSPNNTCEFLSTAINLGSFTLGTQSFDIAGLKVYPNPVTDGNLYITSDSNNTKSVAIFDVLGKQVVNTTVNNQAVNVSNLNAGVYIVKITEAGKTATKKLVIE